MKKGFSEPLEFEFYPSDEREPMFLKEHLATLSNDKGPVLEIFRSLPTDTLILQSETEGWTATVGLQEIAESV